MKRFLALLATAFLLAGCAAADVASSAGHHSSKTSGAPRCADLLAHAMTSQSQTVRGVYACLTPGVQQAVSVSIGVNSDADFRTYASSDPVYTSYRFVNTRPSTTNSETWYSFRLSGVSGERCFGVRLDPQGLVDNAAFGEVTTAGLC